VYTYSTLQDGGGKTRTETHSCQTHSIRQVSLRRGTCGSVVWPDATAAANAALLLMLLQQLKGNLLINN